MPVSLARRMRPASGCVLELDGTTTPRHTKPAKPAVTVFTLPSNARNPCLHNVTKQTTIVAWLVPMQAREIPPGTTGIHPIVIDDVEDIDENDAQVGQLGLDGAHPIVITDDDSDDDEPLPKYIPVKWPILDAQPQPPEHCENAASAVYCGNNNCAVGQSCGNRLHDHPSLVLMHCIKGLGVMTTSPIPEGTVIGQYCGLVIPHSQLTVKRVVRGFVLKFKSRATNRERVFVDAYAGGGLCRFVNHSCSPNAKFEERALGSHRRMVITALKDIPAGDEITVRYRKRVKFVCLCGAANCISRAGH